MVEVERLNRIVCADAVMRGEFGEARSLRGFVGGVSAMLIRLLDECVVLFGGNDVECFGHSWRIRN